MSHPLPQPAAAGQKTAPDSGRGGIWRWWSLLTLVLLAVIVYAAGLDERLSLAAVARNRDALRDFADSHWLAAMLGYAAIYIAMTVASLPAAAMMSIAGGFLFGWWISAPLSVMSATLGAMIVFSIVRTTAGRTLARHVGPVVAGFQRGFAAGAFHYLLALRLLPVVPFFMVNTVAGLCHVKPMTFAAATALGIIPGAFAYAWLGTGLDNVILVQRQAYETCVAAKGAAGCKLEFDPSALLTPQIAVAFVALAAMALLPLLARHLRRQSKA